jgi:hypothetical protein
MSTENEIKRWDGAWACYKSNEKPDADPSPVNGLPWMQGLIITQNSP